MQPERRLPSGNDLKQEIAEVKNAARHLAREDFVLYAEGEIDCALEACFPDMKYSKAMEQPLPLEHVEKVRKAIYRILPVERGKL